MPKLSKVPETAPAGSRICFKCSGRGRLYRGRFYSGGAVVNGVYTGSVGSCCGCQGKGWQSPADIKRCAAY